MTPEEYVQLRAFARYDGLLLSILWTLTFALYIVGLSSPSVGLLAMLLIFTTPFMAGHRLKNYRDYGLQGVVSFRRAWAYVTLTFFYASLLFALIQYVYFAYMDHGYFMQRLQQLTDTPENREAIRQLASSSMIDEMLNSMSSVRPIDLALSMLQTNVLVGAMLGLPLAAILSSKKKTISKQ